MGYLFFAIAFFMLYYFVEQKVIKSSLKRTAQKFVSFYESLNKNREIDLTKLRRNTNFYKLDPDTMVFKSITGDNPDLAIMELDFKDLERFTKIMEGFKNNVKCAPEFFKHKRHKQLVYPFRRNDEKLEIILLSTYSDTVNEIFDRTVRRS